MCNLYQIFYAYCLRSWLSLSLAKGAKSAIYDCLVVCVFVSRPKRYQLEIIYALTDSC